MYLEELLVGNLSHWCPLEVGEEGRMPTLGAAFARAKDDLLNVSWYIVLIEFGSHAPAQRRSKMKTNIRT